MRRPLVRGGTELGQRQNRDGEFRDKPRCLPCAERLGDGARGPLAAHQGGERLTRSSVRAVEVRYEDPDVVVDVLQVLPALELHQHVRELLAASGVDRADDERGHVRVQAQVPFDPVGEHPRRNRVPAGALRQLQRARQGRQQALRVGGVGGQARAPVGGQVGGGHREPSAAQRHDERKAQRHQLREGPPGGFPGLRRGVRGAFQPVLPELGPGHQPQQPQRVQRRREHDGPADAVLTGDGGFYRVDGEHLAEIRQQPSPLCVVGPLGLP